jgi:hypothetical protein
LDTLDKIFFRILAGSKLCFYQHVKATRKDSEMQR